MFKSKLVKHLLIILTLFFALLFAGVITLLNYYDPYDTCLDGGGCWDETREVCRLDEPAAQLYCHKERLINCSVDQACQKGFTCVDDQILANPKCVPSPKICFYLCGEDSCNIMESLPAQVSCSSK